jgi:hypothetical protein
VKGRQYFSAKEVTVQLGVSCTVKDGEASGLIVTQGHGRIRKLTLDCPVMMRFG